MNAKKRGLGRGLDALLGTVSTPATRAAEGMSTKQDMRDVPVDLIQRGKYQPRRDMDQVALEELAQSIRAQGVLQPIVLRSVSDQKFEIIAGERRWRATQLAGLDTIPAIVREVPDEAAVAMSLIENIQREDLNPIEEATALQRLQLEFELTQQQIAEAVGKSRSTVTNLLRLMSLREDVRRLLEHGDLEAGHGKALLGLPEAQQAAAASAVVGRSMSVRQTEDMVRKILARARQPGTAPRKPDPDIQRLQDELSQKLGAKVQIQHNAKGKGKLVLAYNSLAELDGILEHIK
ncbi:MAG: ParB/RepB/Spo0J family partition protein [Gammaproteobacteria bacterium]|nr:ParB/RepB/Spo0J family partition protein [Gammaproteobacteria bacterium]